MGLQGIESVGGVFDVCWEVHAGHSGPYVDEVCWMMQWGGCMFSGPVDEGGWGIEGTILQSVFVLQDWFSYGRAAWVWGCMLVWLGIIVALSGR